MPKLNERAVTKYKGLPHLIEAERYMQSDCVVVIGGKEPFTGKLQILVRNRCTNRIPFVGRLSDDDQRCYLYAADVFAFPFVTKNEAFGVALAEAMYCNTPAVIFTINGSGVNWVSPNGVTGIEVANGNTKAYVAAIDRLINDKTLRLAYAQTAHERVKDNFLIRHMVDAMEGVYKNLCDNNNSDFSMVIRIFWGSWLLGKNVQIDCSDSIHIEREERRTA
ncbi:MAG: glycosyltransferase [Bacteroidaceae bacterium]|nr:glycosyltransferase [Bacteroidaceae bacterium]